MTRASWLRWLIGLGVSAVLIVLAYRGTDGKVIVDTIAHAQPSYTVASMFCLLASFAIRCWRWRLCFDPEDEVTIGQSVGAYGIGNASTQVIPSRLGDLVRVYVLGQCSGVSKSKALGTLVVERLSDLFTVVLMLTVMLPAFDVPASFKAADLTGAALAIAALIVVYLLARAGPDLHEPAWVRRRGFTHAAFGMMIQLLRGFSAVRSPARAAAIMISSFAVWGLTAVAYTLWFWAVSLPLGWTHGTLLTAIFALTAIVPSGPSFAGSFDLVGRTTLGLFGVDPSVAAGYVNYTRVVSLIAIAIFTVIALVPLKLSWRRTAPEPAEAGRRILTAEATLQ